MSGENTSVLFTGYTGTIEDLFEDLEGILDTDSLEINVDAMDTDVIRVRLQNASLPPHEYARQISLVNTLRITLGC